MMKQFWLNTHGYISNRVVWAVVMLALAGLVFFTSGCGKKEEPIKKEVIRPVKIMTIQTAGAGASRSYPGQVRASRRVDLAFKIAGPLVELPVDEGQDVKRGQLIARILPRDFKIRLDQAKAKALEAEQQYQRYRDLYVKKQVSKADFDKYKSQRDVAIARQEDAQNALKDTNLKAPFAGIIATRYVENFEEVQAKQPIVFLQDIRKVEMLVNVSESEMALVRDELDDKAYARFPTAPGKRFVLEMKEFSTQADPKTQTYQVVMVMSQPEEINVLPGMTGTVVIEQAGEANTAAGPQIVIPAIAVVASAEGSPYVWGIDPKSMTAKKLPVKIGQMTGSENVIVQEGLSGGETIAVAGVTKLAEGMQVRIWKETP
jgi:multidrug efflux system membrane fusion protein